MLAGVDPATVATVAWNSDATGIYANAKIKGKLSRDAAGNWMFTIPVVSQGGLYKDSGFITLIKKDGSLVTLNHREWTMWANAALTSSSVTCNMIQYDLTR